MHIASIEEDRGILNILNKLMYCKETSKKAHLSIGLQY